MLVAWIDNPAIRFDTFDPQLNLLNETNFTLPSGVNEGFGLLKLADVNGDGKLDLIAVSDTLYAEIDADFTLWVFLGNGDSTFQPPVSQDLGVTAAGFSDAVVGDLNGDGKPDVVLVVNGFGPVGIALLGNGDGTFHQQNLALITSPSDASVASLALGDLNGDGKLDLVVSTGPSVAVDLGNGDGTFQTPALFPVQADGNELTVAIGDVNGDGIPDIVTSSGSILFGDGKGNFPSRRDYAIATPENDNGTVMLADFDGDGIADILIGAGNPVFLSGTGSPTLTVLLGQGKGIFAAAPVSLVGVPGAGANQSVDGDFDGDGIPDLAVSDFGFLAILKDDGKGDFSVADQVNLQAFQGSAVSIAVADFNRDGKLDLAALMDIAEGTGSEVAVFYGNGDGTLSAPLILQVGATFPSFLGASDLNGDGLSDLVASVKNTVFIWLGKPGGTFAPPVTYSVQGGYLSSGEPVSLAFGDFNSDGKMDIAVPGQAAGIITLLLGKGDGTFTMGASIPLSMPPPSADFSSLGPVILAAADLNGDGRLDLIASLADSDGGSFGFAVLLGNGDGTFQPPILNPQPANAFTVADMNGDKIPDLIVSGTSVLLGNGDGTFQTGLLVFGALEAVAVADFNRDGTLDIAGGMSTGGIATFLNLTAPPPPLTVVPATTFLLGTLAPNSFASAFGRALTNQAQSLTITVLDSAVVSRPAPLIYVSPDQINFLIPAGTASGTATVTVTSATGKFTAQVQIAATAPTLFTEGNGIAAAYVTQVAADGSQTNQYVFTAQSGSLVPLPINVTSAQTYLILYGTGFDTASTPTASVQGVPVPVTYAGPQPDLPGLDQANILLPPSLAGTGVASVVFTAGNIPANTVFVTIQ